MTEEKLDLAAELAALGITVKSVFVPFSQSRNKDSKDPSLNWKVTVQRNGRDVVNTDYMAGSAHCPAYSRPAPSGFDRPARMWRPLACAFECEHGYALASPPAWSREWRADPKRPILPDAVNVIWCLTTDAGVLDYASFEQWADDYGYESDSRKAEATYQACLANALALRAGLGAETLIRLADLFQDY